ncbi:DNA mismatch repair protein MutL [Candidatus Pantoea edessiphila]|uniref:DNA mismatch repair protein MutL n=1 Tax=Candidatus Pantoea edessiphila TaxID=2044610 RepID=A0A2P5T1M8_9GAMM|nr:DNA mismatch repair endonuclease MutL [Candidatus Pantoea edessiphila]PPI88495.1 DNA mismatch repair protein MutL [Candidatus Pantoea edessiphila]
MSIKILPPYLINQISAGEIIERPVSVVKELIENSLDAGANRIDINIKKGGMKLIQIQDNGCGIIRNELSISLERYATSKIRSIKDLEIITSLGFRGEALTSISSVSRLTLTSRTVNQNQAWQIYTEGNKIIDVKIKPATHPIGTTVKVFDLFYNTPVRRKFMKTEKIEFNHIYNMINQILLARFDVTISFSHNDYLIYYQPAVITENQIKRRLGFVCGTNFVKNCLRVDYQQDNLSIHGWIINRSEYKIIDFLQYCYVNGRIIKDKLISNAIRQAFNDQLKNNEKPSYVIYLEINPSQLDINIHPTKKEIRFYQPRLVYDFIIQGITNVLEIYYKNKVVSIVLNKESKNQSNDDHMKNNDFFSLPDWYFKDDVSNLIPKEIKEHYNSQISVCKLPYVTVKYPKYFGHLLTVLKNSYAVLKKNQTLRLMSLPVAFRYLKQSQLQNRRLKSQTRPLLIPLKIKIRESYLKTIQKNNSILNSIGICFQIETDHITLLSIPSTLHVYDLKVLIHEIVDYLFLQKNISIQQLCYWLAIYENKNDTINWTNLKVNILLTEIEYFCPDLLRSPPSNLIQQINIKNTINMLNNV